MGSLFVTDGGTVGSLFVTDGGTVGSLFVTDGGKVGSLFVNRRWNGGIAVREQTVERWDRCS